MRDVVRRAAELSLEMVGTAMPADRTRFNNDLNLSI